MVVITHQTLSLEKYWKLFPTTLIKPAEWRTAQQINSLFSCQTASRHRGIDAEEISEEDIEAA